MKKGRRVWEYQLPKLEATGAQPQPISHFTHLRETKCKKGTHQVQE